MKNLTRLILILITSLSFAAFVPTLKAQDSSSQPISVDDVKQLRKIIADRDFYKNSLEESERQKIAWQDSSAKWQKLYNEEKSRADGVQENRVSESLKAYDDLQKANKALHDQSEMDKQKIGELEFDVRKYKSERKWYFAGGVVVGAAAGITAGYQTGKRYGVGFRF